MSRLKILKICLFCSLSFFKWVPFNYLCIYFSLHWISVALCGFSLVVASRGYSSLWWLGFSLLWLLLLWSIGSRCTAFSSCKRGPSCCSLWALECGLSICGTGGLVTLRHVESSWTRDQICVPCFGRWILVHCTTTREVPPWTFLRSFFLMILTAAYDFFIFQFPIATLFIFV